MTLLNKLDPIAEALGSAIARFEALTGRRLEHLGWYEAWRALRGANSSAAETAGPQNLREVSGQERRPVIEWDDRRCCADRWLRTLALTDDTWRP